MPVFFSAVLAHLVQDRTLFLGIKLVSHLVIKAILTAEDDFESVAYLAVLQVIFGIDIEPVVVVRRIYMGSKDLIGIERAVHVEVQSAVELGDLVGENDFLWTQSA